MTPRPQTPLATYRLQLNRTFTFNQAAEIVPYLSALGISHCYISPCLKARPGSMHGYDIVDHNSLNPEVGSPEEFDRFVAKLHDHGMGLIMDIVPNHMGVMGSDNAWWMDVLENGESSPYANFFDIEWHPSKDELDGKVLVPVLADHYGAVLESGDLKLVFRPERGEFDISYFDHRFPVNPREYPRVLEHCTQNLTEELGPHNPDLLEFQSLIASFGHLPARQQTGAESVAERNRDKEIHKRRLGELCARAPAIASCLARAVEKINGTPSDPASFEELHQLIKAQAFRLANWRVASDDINYRRFFDTNDLAGISVENEAVFEATHRLVFQLMHEGKVDGLRVDHPDGLYDPAQYFERLRRGMQLAASGNNEPFVVIEKILTGPERLPRQWPVAGTTGYDFANLVNGLFVDSSNATRTHRTYRNFIGDDLNVDDLAYRCRKLIIRVALASELNVLASRLMRIALAKRRTCDFTFNSLRDALAEVASSFPVYRTYIASSGVSDNDARYLRTAIALAKRRSPAADTSVFDFLHEALLTRIAESQDPAYANAVTNFAMKFQQFTGPVMAKGLEDTAFYRFNRLASLNEVGSDLHRFGTPVIEFHEANQERAAEWPHTMLATSTHDSKRSEDVRARIDVLSEMPAAWRLRVREWSRINRNHKRIVNDRPAPSPNDEYLLYQTLLGAWPVEALQDEDSRRSFSARIEGYMLKAIREAKQNTSWINQNTEYENSVFRFVNALLNFDANQEFLNDFLPFQRRIARIGVWNSLSQTLLKLTCPGIPDIYQGTEIFDFSLVDPDNRRPVDYARRHQMFRCLGSGPDAAVRQMLENPEDGRLKIYLTWKALCLRKRQPELFQRGEYLPLAVEGAKAAHLVAFLRNCESTSVLVAVPRLIAGLLNDAEVSPTGPEVWQDTRILLPSRATRCNNAFTGQAAEITESGGQRSVPASQVLAQFPVALCGLSS